MTSSDLVWRSPPSEASSESGLHGDATTYFDLERVLAVVPKTLEINNQLREAQHFFAIPFTTWHPGASLAGNFTRLAIKIGAGAAATMSWDTARFEIERRAGLHPNLDTMLACNGTSVNNNKAGVVFAWRLDDLTRYCRSIAAASNDSVDRLRRRYNPLATYRTLEHRRTFEVCPWLLGDDVVHANECVVFVRWPLKMPFRAYVPESVYVAHRDRLRTTIAALAPTTSLFQDDNASTEAARIEALVTAATTGADNSDAATMDADTARRRRIQQKSHMGDACLLFWKRPHATYQCTHCGVVGVHHALACRDAPRDQNGDIERVYSRVPKTMHGIPKSMLAETQSAVADNKRRATTPTMSAAPKRRRRQNEPTT